MTAEFRLADDKTEAGVGIRTLTALGLWPDKGYRATLAGKEPPGQLVARRGPLAVIRPTRLSALSAGEWHRLIVAAEGDRITVTIDDTIASISTVADRVGSVLFDVRRGSAEFRAINVRGLPIATNALRPDSQHPDPDLKLPRVVKEVRPTYTLSAVKRKVEGTVHFDAVVLADGSVGAVDALKFEDPDLEQSAVAAVTQWRFSPATLKGKPVAVWVEIEMTFTLR